MELTKKDIHNILIFLNRSTMNGEEVPTFVEVYGKLQEMLKEPEKVE